MFYSHEILTSREHGVATVWLVATLGAKSNTKKVNRKAILDVDVPKACDIIVHPEAPMALRLQGNLLYGVSKVYHQQCGYALLDAQATRDRMMTVLKIVRNAALDPDAGKARPDQLVLPYDPAFVPELMLPGLNVDLSALDLGTERNSPTKSHLLSSFVPQSTPSNRAAQQQARLNLSSPGVAFGTADRLGYFSDISSARKEDQIELPLYSNNEAGILLQPDFEFDGEGNMIELSAKRTPEPEKRATGEQQLDTKLPNVKRGSLLDPLLGENYLDGDIPMPDINERQDENDAGLGEEAGLNQGQSDPNDTHVNEIQSDPIEPRTQQRLRRPRVLAVDDPAELKNSDLAQWNLEYVQNMIVAAKMKKQNRCITIAKKNAEFWVLGAGIGSVGVGLGSAAVPHPLAAFSGAQLLETLTGIPPKRDRRKRSHGEKDEFDDDQMTPSKRAHMDIGEPDIGRGHDFDMNDGHGDVFDDVEIGRQGPESLQDDSLSHMPWNITASIKSSAKGSSVYSHQLFASGGIYSGMGAPRSVATPGPDGLQSAKSGNLSADFRRRLTSASPLAGRGKSDLRAGINQEININDVPLLGDNIDHDDQASIMSLSDKVPKWMNSNLDQQSVNFYDFLQMGFQEFLETRNSGIAFSSLLPPESNSKIVATQALLHILTLTTSGALRVRQDLEVNVPRGARDAGDIHIMLAD
ncbi:hypothetical protein FQN57_002416 [Myotisia sp. PD_48]|nr:hypothetical protein FQN57_002416 [Myotisia sp. PD_48]